MSWPNRRGAGRRAAVAGIAAVALALAGCAAPGAPPADEESALPVAPGAADAPAGSAAAPAAIPGEAGRSGEAAAHPKAPRQGSTWHYQLDGAPPGSGVDVYAIDGADTPARDVARLKAEGATLVCYFNAGATEDWRSDAGSFPAAVVGEAMDGWAGERWLDVRRLDALLPIMGARMDTCVAKGFDAVDPDNVDAYIQDTGFPITREESARYIIELARLAHDRDLAFGLKNAVELLPLVDGEIDFAVNEECAAWNECGAYDSFVASGHAVLHIEYTDRCTTPPGFSSIRGDYDLNGPTYRCD